MNSEEPLNDPPPLYWNLKECTDASYMFQNCTKLKDADLSGLDVSNISTFDFMFANCSMLSTINISSFNTSSLTTMQQMFNACSSLTEIDVSHFDTTNCTNFAAAFRYCSSLKTITLPEFKMKNLASLHVMCQGCPSLTNFKIKITTGNVTIMNYLVGANTNLETFDISDSDITQATSLYGMFSADTSLTNLIGLDSLSTPNVESFDFMFEGCTSLTEINLSNFDTSNASTFPGMFQNCSALKILILNPKFVIKSNANKTNMFSGCNALKNVYIGPDREDYETFANLIPVDLTWFPKIGWLSVNVTLTETYYTPLVDNEATIDIERLNNDGVLTSCEASFSGQSDLIRITNINSLDTSEVIKTNDMFLNCASLTELDISNFDMSNVDSPRQMFQGCHALKTLKLGVFNAVKCVNLEHMFWYCWNLEDLDMSNFITSSLAYRMNYMFCECRSLKKLDLRGFNTSTVWIMDRMFRDCNSLVELNVSSFETPANTTLEDTFRNCTLLPKLDLSGFDTSITNNMSNTFNGCISLVTLILGTKFVFKSGVGTSNMFKNCNALTYIWLKSKATGTANTIKGLLPSGNWVWDESTGWLVKDPYTKTNGIALTTAYYSTNDNVTTIDTSAIINAGRLTSCDHGMQKLDATKISNLDQLNTMYVTSMSYMFHQCETLESLDLRNLMTANVKTMNHMFNECYALKSIDISGFDVSNVTAIDGLFQDCHSLTRIDVSMFDMTGKSYNNMFFRCTALEELVLNDTFDCVWHMIMYDDNLKKVWIAKNNETLANKFISELPAGNWVYDNESGLLSRAE